MEIRVPWYYHGIQTLLLCVRIGLWRINGSFWSALKKIKRHRRLYFWKPKHKTNCGSPPNLLSMGIYPRPVKYYGSPVLDCKTMPRRDAQLFQPIWAAPISDAQEPVKTRAGRQNAVPPPSELGGGTGYGSAVGFPSEAYALRDSV